jgi:LmbE family N-acetylglucosaminyl deacetylase
MNPSSPAGHPRSSRPRLLGVFAHPDDETACAGGTFAKYVAEGAEAMVVSATRGEAGQIRDAAVATRRTLGRVREQELYLACRRLGIEQVACLDYRDGTLPDVDREELVGQIVRIMSHFRPDVVITFGPDGGYGHPDHITIGAATTDAFARAFQADTGPDPAPGRTSSSSSRRLYHSRFVRSRRQLLTAVAKRLVSREARFRGTMEFLVALSVFAEESSTLGHFSDFVDVRWFPTGTYIVEQGEPGTNLFLILSGQARVVREEADGEPRELAQLGPGEFFGEVALAYHAPRAANVIAAEPVTCLILSPGQPTPFAGRGSDAVLVGPASTTTYPDDGGGSGVTTCIDVSAYVDQKAAAVAAHHTQYPVDPRLFPAEFLRELLSREYFVRVAPPLELETSLLPAAAPRARAGVRRRSPTDHRTRQDAN